jgi:iron complex outermembrane receptor protein
MTRQKFLFKTLAAAWMVGSAGAGIVMADEVSQLSEVVVTAERRTENLQKTPVAVTALSSDVMKERSVTDTWDLMQVVPGLQVSTQNPGDNGGSATFFLRGMGEQRGGNGQEPAVGVYVDGIYYPSLEGDAFDIVDLQQVQVLRGPQGTLFGRDTIGGAILYTTRKPVNYFTVDATATVGNLGRNDYTGTLNIPLTQWLAVRLTAGRLKTDGYVRVQSGGADAGGKETSLGRIAVRATPGNELTIDLAMQYSHQYLDGFAYDMPAPFIVGPLFPSWWNLNPTHAGELYGPQYGSQCTYCQAETDLRDFSDTRTPNASLVATWRPADDFSIKSLTGWTEVRNGEAGDLDGSPLPIFESYTESKDTALSEELQVNDATLSGRLVWVGGLYYYHDHGTVPYGWNTDALPPPGTGVPLTLVGLPVSIPDPYSTTDTKSYAAYVNGTYRLVGGLSIIAGYRYSDDDKHDSTVGFTSAHATFGSNTWRAGLQYQWTPSVMSYATVSTGFRAGGFNPAGGTPPVGFVAFKPENDRSYELGMRMDLLDRRLRLNPTIFYNDWSDIQVQSAVALPGAGLVIELQNAAQAHTYGAELEAEARATEHLTLFGNFSSLTAHYTSIGDASGITINSHFERAPPVTYSLGGTYAHPVTRDLILRGTLNWSWEATQNSTPTDIDTLSLHSYGLMNGRLELSTAAHWSFALFGTNLLNKVYYVGGINFSANVGSAQYDLGAPREYGLSVRYNYQ